MTSPLRSESLRYAKAAAERLGLEFRILDTHSGYLCRIHSDSASLVLGAGSVSSWPVNNATAATLANDKYFTNLALSDRGIPVPAGESIFLSERYRDVREPGRELDDAPKLAERIGFPVIAKPNSGSRGAFVHLCHDLAELERHLERMKHRFDLAILQRYVPGDEYRVLVYDGDAIFSYRKRRATLVADGRETVTKLLAEENRKLVGKGLDPVPFDSTFLLRSLDRLGLTLESVPAAGIEFEIAPRANVSAGATPEEFTADPPPHLAGLAIRAAAALGLTVAGVDLIVPAGSESSEPVVLELNSNPTISSLELVGRTDIAVALYERALKRVLFE